MKTIMILITLSSALNIWAASPENDGYMGDQSLSSEQVTFIMNQHGKIEAGVLNHKRLLLDELIQNTSADLKLLGSTKASGLIADYGNLLDRLSDMSEEEVSYNDLELLEKEYDELAMALDESMER